MLYLFPGLCRNSSRVFYFRLSMGSTCELAAPGLAYIASTIGSTGAHGRLQPQGRRAHRDYWKLDVETSA